MKNNKLLIALLILLAGCGQQEVKQEQEQQETVATTHSSEQKKKSENNSIIQCTGEISVPPEAEVSIHSPIGGLIKTIRIMDGEYVKKGQVLATLEHLSIIKIQEEYLTAKSQFEYAKKEFDRKTELYEKVVVSAKEYDSAKQSYQSANAHYESMKNQVQFLGISLKQLDAGKIQNALMITSPINGYVTHVTAKTGKYAAQDTELFNLIDDSHKHVHLKVFAEDAGKLKTGQIITLKTADSDKTYEAEVYLIGKNIDPGTNTVALHGHLKEDTDELIVGTFVFAEIRMK